MHFLLSAVKTPTPHCRFYFAGSSERFGQTETVPQSRLSAGDVGPRLERRYPLLSFQTFI